MMFAFLTRGHLATLMISVAAEQAQEEEEEKLAQSDSKRKREVSWFSQNCK